MTHPVRDIATRLVRSLVAAAALVSALGVSAPACAAPHPGLPSRSDRTGLWVESVEPQSRAERAGMRAGDLLLEWRRAAAPPLMPLPGAGRLETPFDLETALIEEAPRGAFDLLGKRGGQPLSFALGLGLSVERIGLGVRPSLTGPVLALYREGLARLAAGRVAEGLEAWRRASDRAFEEGDGEAGDWLLGRRATALAEARSIEAGDRAFAGLATARPGSRRQRAGYLDEWGRWLDRRREWKRAAVTLREAATLLRSDPGAPLALARVLHDLAEVYRHSDDYASAEEAHSRALAIRSLWAPASLATVESLLGTARVLLEADRGDARPPIELAAALAAKIDPEGLPHSRVLDFLGLVYQRYGDRQGAEGSYLRALAAARAAPRGHFEQGRALVHLAALVGGGDPVRMEDLLRRALVLFRSLPDDFLNRSNLALTLVQLAFLRSMQGDQEAAYDLAREAAEVHRGLNPGSHGHIDALVALGKAARLLKRFDEARNALEEALRLRESSASAGELAEVLSMLGHVEVDAKTNLDRAEVLLRRALQLFEEKRPGSLELSHVLLILSEALALRGELEEAIGLARRGVALRAELAPDGVLVAEALWMLSGWEKELGRKVEASRTGCEAAAILQRERMRLRGRTAAGFALASAYWRIVVDCAASRVALGEAEAAFQLIEGERGKTLLDLREMRVLHGTGREAVSPALSTERERWAEDYERLTSQLSAFGSDAGAEAVRDLQRKLADHQDRYEDLAHRIRDAAPGGTASAVLPGGPRGFDEIRRSLGRGAALLSYAVGETETLVFVVRGSEARAQSLAAFRLSVGENELEREVAVFRSLAEDPGADPASLFQAGRSLYSLLLEPAEAAFSSAKRLLIVPDGALQSLPFAALRRRDGRYLVEAKALGILPAVAFLSKARQPPARPSRVAAFADPMTDYAPLPGARLEVDSLRSAFPRTTVFQGTAATEAAALGLLRSEGRKLDLIHFAVHSLIDERYPLRSALLLGTSASGAPNPEDGRLEAREIVEEGRFEARLVTLSSCESGLGKKLRGEGLVGLTQAFLIAGARSVLASLWSVPDASTADFMRMFYARLRRGEPADEALRRAQVERLRSPATAPPAYWAAFALFGSGE